MDEKDKERVSTFVVLIDLKAAFYTAVPGVVLGNLNGGQRQRCGIGSATQWGRCAAAHLPRASRGAGRRMYLIDRRRP